MIVDGVKVLYTMRNGKVVDPNIPTEGLVCYLDTRGKYNADVYRNTLLDLSGNGNHGTLKNFNFTDESGYVNDSSGGLKFDGVDDGVTISGDFIFDKEPFTYFVDFKIPRTAKEQNTSIHLGLGFYSHQANNLIYTSSTNNPNGDTFGSTQVGVGSHIFICTLREDFTKAKYFLDGNSVSIYNTLLPDGTPVIFKIAPWNKGIFRGGAKEINRLMIWNRALTDTEIQQLMEV